MKRLALGLPLFLALLSPGSVAASPAYFSCDIDSRVVEMMGPTTRPPDSGDADPNSHYLRMRLLIRTVDLRKVEHPYPKCPFEPGDEATIVAKLPKCWTSKITSGTELPLTYSETRWPFGSSDGSRLIRFTVRCPEPPDSEG